MKGATEQSWQTIMVTATPNRFFTWISLHIALACSCIVVVHAGDEKPQLQR